MYVSKYKNQTNSGNNSILVRAEFDLCAPLQANSMAGLNLSNPKTEPNHPLLLCQTCWCVVLFRSSSYLKVQDFGPQSGSAAWGWWTERRTQRGVEGSETKWAGVPTRDVDVTNATEKQLSATLKRWGGSRGIRLCVRVGSVKCVHLITFLNYLGLETHCIIDWLSIIQKMFGLIKSLVLATLTVHFVTVCPL